MLTVQGIETRMNSGTPFEVIEGEIEDMPVNDNEKAALWLFAWSLRDRSEARLDALAHLAVLTL